MVRGVNADSGSVRARRVADTEERLIRAATTLFIRDGYPATTLAAVAAEAGLAARTVYLRFGTKAALLKRAVDVALVGDTAPVDVAGREWFQRSLTAPTLDERIAAGARASRDIMQRAGRLMAVARQAEPTEPVIAAAAQAGRETTRDQLRTFWVKAAEDGLLPAGSDVAWLGETSAVICAADTYLLTTRTLGWDPDDYERWLLTTWHRLVAAATAPA
jgi:AcrR family transcriptional regulator